MPEAEFTSTIHKQLRKSASLGNLTVTTAEGTDYCQNNHDDEQKLSAVQCDGDGAKGDRREVESASISEEDDSMEVSLGLSSEDETLPLYLPDGIPSEVMILHDSDETADRDDSPVSSKPDMQQLEMHTTMLKSYRDKLQASNSENDALQDLLKQTQEYAEELLNERKELLQVIEELENECNERNDQELLLKVIVLFSLGVYACGGSAEFLAAAVVLQLFVTLVNLVL